MKSDIEKFLDVKGYEGLYRIGSHGTVISCVKLKGRAIKNETTLSPGINVRGYKSVVLKHNKKAKTITIHRLVAIAFIPNPENKPCVNHIDGNKLNNNLSNLEWCTYSENIRHAFKTGLKITKSGGDNHRAIKVKDTVTGEIYGSITIASEKTTYSRDYLYKVFQGKSKNNTNLIKIE